MNLIQEEMMRLAGVELIEEAYEGGISYPEYIKLQKRLLITFEQIQDRNLKNNPKAKPREDRNNVGYKDALANSKMSKEEFENKINDNKFLKQVEVDKEYINAARGFLKTDPKKVEPYPDYKFERAPY